MNKFFDYEQIIEYDKKDQTIYIYLDNKALAEFKEGIDILRDLYDHDELCSELSDTIINPDRYHVEWFQFNHLHAPEGWDKLLWFEGWETSVECCLDNAGVSILLEKLSMLEKPNVKEVVLQDGVELSPPHLPLDENFELVRCVRLIQLGAEGLENGSS